jgi:hypothetical protein
MKKFFIRTIISAVIAVSLVSSAFIPVSAETVQLQNRNDILTIVSADLLKNPSTIKYSSYNSQIQHGSENLSDLNSIYSPFPIDEFKNICEQFKTACDENYEFSEIYTAANEINTDVFYAIDLCNIAQIIYYTDTSNSDYLNEMTNAFNLYYSAYDMFCESMKYAVSNENYYDQFVSKLGQNITDSYLNYISGNNSDAEYDSQFNKLTNEYYTLINNNASEEEFAELYLKTVDLNNSYAQSKGYNNYIEYSYDLYSRDYTVDEAMVFGNYISENISSVYSRLLSEIKNSENYNSYKKLSYTPDKAISALSSHIGDISSEMKEACDYMIEYETYSIVSKNAAPTRMDGGFTTYFSTIAEPYIFITKDDSVYDVKTLIHEFGHYNEMYQTGTSGWSIDLAEISSQALELLYIPYYSDIFGEELADISEMHTVASILWAIVSGCTIAEFETTVYENPDMTVDEVISLYDDLQNKYTPSDKNLDWNIVSHLFIAPGYYISYATSAVAACEIWNKSFDDKDAAISNYIEISSYGSNGGLKEVLSECGMNDMFSDETVSEITETINRKYNLIPSTESYDIDGDGEITSYDALIILEMTCGMVESDLSSDIDNDGKITSSDALLILQNMVELG